MANQIAMLVQLMIVRANAEKVCLIARLTIKMPVDIHALKMGSGKRECILEFIVISV